MVQCRNCSREIPDDSRFCPYCGLERSFLITNYDLRARSPEIVSGTVTTMSSYFLTGSAFDVQQYQGSPIAEAEHQEFQTRWAKLPEEFWESILTNDQAVLNLNIETMRNERAIKIVRSMLDANIVFRAKRNATLFRENLPTVVNELHTPCCGYASFMTKLASLATLFEVYRNPLTVLVNAPRNKGPLKLVEDFLDENNFAYEAEMLETWKNIKILRNMPPIHAGRGTTREARKYLQALGFFGMNLPIDYARLWEEILNRFLESLQKWQTVLNSIP